jgi:hypothetical protein
VICVLGFCMKFNLSRFLFFFIALFGVFLRGRMP